MTTVKSCRDAGLFPFFFFVKVNEQKQTCLCEKKIIIVCLISDLSFKAEMKQEELQQPLNQPRHQPSQQQQNFQM